MELTSNHLLQPSVPATSDTEATDQSLWMKVSPETAVQVSGGQIVMAE